MAGLHLHRSESAQSLVDTLVHLLAAPRQDPFEPDVVAVPARGIERWITQQLATHLGATGKQDGICARVEFPRPDDLLLRVIAAASDEHRRAVDAWQPGRVVWSMLDVLDEVLLEAPNGGSDWCAALRAHLTTADGSPSERRYGVAHRLTERFAGYAAARPHLIKAWHAGDDTAPADLSWQPELWRRLRERVAAPSPAELLDGACAELRRRPEVAGLPERISVFGASRLDAANLQVLDALADRREVHLWVNAASPALWNAVRESGHTGPRRADLRVRTNSPLLASLSRDVREMQARLSALNPASDVHHPPARRAKPQTLLEHLQASLSLDDRPAQPVELKPDDRSVQVHACHGRARQVEVLREVVVGLLEDVSGLEPRDVLIMCPDVETYAPLIEAAFGDDGHPGSTLRVSMADRSPRMVNPLLGVAADLLDLAAGRIPATEVLDLAGADPVRERFGFDDDDLERLHDWTVAAGVRWGLDADHRDGWSLGDIPDGTWRTGVDRILAGVALDEDGGLCGTALPIDGIDSAAIELAGRFAEFVDRLDDAVIRMAGRHTAGVWGDLLERSVAALADVPADEPWQATGLRRVIDELRDSAVNSTAEICLAEFTALVGARLQARPTTAGFRTGGLTVCTLTPMRSVPHRVVCLLGMDDGAFPRPAPVDGDDLLLRDPCLGERDPRSEDRQLLLDALCAAGEYLVVTYCGSDVRTGAQLPPAVPLGELLDALDGLVVTTDGGPARDAVVVQHPLQPFDRRNFRPGALGRPGPFSFDALALASAEAADAERADEPDLLDGPLPEEVEDVVALDRLVSFWQHPAREFLRQRLDVVLPSAGDFPDDALPIALDALDRWGMGDRVLQDCLRGLDAESARVLERARGALPPSPLGDGDLADTCAVVDRLLAASSDVRTGTAETVDVDVPLPDGRRLTGAVRGVHGNTVVSVIYSRVRAKQRFRAWAQLLALTVAQPDRPWRAVVVGRGEDPQLTVVTLGPVDPETARTALAELVRLRDAGRRTPLPLPIATGEAYAAARRRNPADLPAARKAAEECWVSGRYDKEDAEEAHVLAWGAAAPLERLEEWTAPPGALDPGTTGPTDFDRLARTVWEPLLAHEKQESR
ncbi:exodeoxyribonuclease V subunit gamma [Geodermatophilus sp. SYSU D01106]